MLAYVLIYLFIDLKLSRLIIEDKTGKTGFKEYKILTRYDNKVILPQSYYRGRGAGGAGGL